MMRSARAIFLVVLVCFFVSGVAGLVYEIVWTRYLALFLGHTSYAVVAVLVAFMGGLALGNAWLGDRVDRAPSPLKFYAWLEIGVGVYGLIFPTYEAMCHSAYVSLARSWQPGRGGLLALKFAFGLLTVLLPTFLMGGTLPALTRFVTRSLAELREKVAALYFINSSGAVMGCIVADFWWIPSWGLGATVLGGAILNLSVGVVAMMLVGWTRGAETAKELPAAKSEEQFSAAELKRAVICIGISGFVAMLYEVAWTRLLALALGSSTHAFSLMLMTFIAGIAVGGWIVYRWRGLRSSLAAFGWAELALAVTLFGSMFFYEDLPYWFVKLADLLARDPKAYPLYEFLQAMICFGVMFVPTVCLGMTLPLVSRIATAELARTGRSVGRVFAVNTLGTVLGAAMKGLVLMPTLGLAKTFALGVAANAAVALAILRPRRPPLQMAMAALAALALVGSFSGLLFSRWPQSFTMGLWRNTRPPSDLRDYHQSAAGNHLEFYRDGASGTVSVNSWPRFGSKINLSLKVNGKADASTDPRDIVTQLLLGHVPMLLHAQPNQVLVVGLGSGMTCGAVMRHLSVQRLDVVEISPDVATAARLFDDDNWGVLHDTRRVFLHNEDAKSYLQITTRQYDVIISEPSNPWMAGVAGLFTREFYENCRGRLRPDGLMVQWIHTYETSDEALDIVLRTLGSVFPNVSIWQGQETDLILVGSLQPLSVNLDAMRTRFHESKVEADLARADISTLPMLLAREVISQANGRFVATPGPLHSDTRPRLDYIAQQAFFARHKAERWKFFDEVASPRPTTLLGRYLQTRPLTANDYRQFTRCFMDHQTPPPEIFRSLLLRWQREVPNANEPIEIAAQVPDPKSTSELQALRLAAIRDSIWSYAEKNPTELIQYREFLLAAYRQQRSTFYLPHAAELEAVLQRLVATDGQNQRIYKLELAEIAWDRGDDDACFQLAQQALDPAAGKLDDSLDPQIAPDILARMAESAWRRGQADTARKLLQMATAARYSSPLLDMTRRKMSVVNP